MADYQYMPDLSEQDYAALKADIAARGVMVPVEYDDEDNVLDGHHRVRICGELGITEWPRIVRSFETEDAKRTHCRQLNLARRHMNQEQRRAVVADELRDNPERSNRQIGADLGVDHKTVADVRNEGLRRGEIPHVSTATDTLGRVQPVSKPRVTGVHMSGDDGCRATLAAAKELRADALAESAERRVANIAEIARGNQALGMGVRYPIVYADPPWRYENPPMGGGNRSIENQYPTMTLEEICALPVPKIVTDDALLYLWATAPKLAECMRVVEAWGFVYRTNLVWVKDKIGMGYHVRNQHELLLVGRRGEIPPPPVEARVSSVVHAPRGKHSEKPDEFYEIIERSYPDLPKIELFARAPFRLGWEIWGNQAAA